MSAVKKVLWEEATDAWTSEDGASGVVFVRVRDTIYVLKGSSRVAEEVFGSKLARLVGIQAPRMRVVEYTSGEWVSIKNALFRLGAGAGRERVRRKLDSELNRAFFLVMECVDGLMLECFPLMAQLCAETEVLARLGQLIALDVFINNSDRIPAVHGNEGNGKNIMMSACGSVYAIDTCMTSIDPKNRHSQPMLQRYLRNVRNFLEAMHGTPTKALRALEPVRDFIMRETGYDIGDAGCLRICEGVQRGAYDVAQLRIPQLSKIRADVDGVVSTDWNGVWTNSIKLIKMDYLEEALIVFKSVCAKYDPPLLDLTPQTSAQQEALEAFDEAPRDAKIMMIQRSPATGEAWAELLSKELTEERARSQRKVDFCVLPEGALACVGEVSIELPELAALSAVAKEHCVYLVCGTMTEVISDTEYYITCACIGDDGELIGAYRKRDTMGAATNGNGVGVFPTRFGKIAILICYDIERDNFVRETLAEEPVLIFNPVHIPSPSGQAAYPDLVRSSWRVALDSSSRRLEHIAQAYGVSIVRVDNPYPTGSANTFLATRSRTVFTPSMMHVDSFCVVVGLTLTAEHQMIADESVGRVRTEREDNTGVRSVARVFRDTRAVESGPCEEIIGLASFVFRGRPKGRLLVTRNQRVQLWDVAEGVVVLNATIPAGVAHCAYSVEGRVVVVDNSGNRFAWDCVGGGAYSPSEPADGDDKLLVVPPVNVNLSVRSKYVRNWTLQCETTHVSLRLDDAAHPHYKISVPLAENPVHVHYSESCGWLCIVSEWNVQILQFFYNRAAVSLADLLPAT